MYKRLIEMKGSGSIFDQIDKIEHNAMTDISSSVNVISHLTLDLISHKKKAIFSDSSLTSELLTLLKVHKPHE